MGVKQGTTYAAECRCGRLPRRGVHTFRILSGAQKGLWFSTMQSDQSFALGRYEPDVSAAIERLVKPGDTFFDVGANVGWHTLTAARKGVRVIAFEPGASNLALLRDTIRRNSLAERVRIEPVGVGSTTETLSFAEYPGYGLVNHVITEERPASPDAVITEIPLVSVDDYVAGHHEIPKVIKIDIEGYELAALMGARQTLEEHRPSVICEVRPENWDDIRSLMGRLGYEHRFLGGHGRGLETAGLDDVLFTRDAGD